MIANRIWQHHFGRGIVRSPNNFGALGTPPTHPELLDWLACELIAKGWRLKPLHRLIMLFRRLSRCRRSRMRRRSAADPTNDLFSHFDMRRLSAEEVRDSILAVAGTLSLKMYGPGVYPEISAEVMAGQSVPGAGWGKSSNEDQARRSVYVHVKRSLILPILETFDLAETDRSSPVRFVTTQPTQALGMLNGSFMNRQARAFASRLKREAGDDKSKQVELALHLATGRKPTDETEIKRGRADLGLLERDGTASPELALEILLPDDAQSQRIPLPRLKRESSRDQFGPGSRPSLQNHGPPLGDPQMPRHPHDPHGPSGRSVDAPGASSCGRPAARSLGLALAGLLGGMASRSAADARQAKPPFANPLAPKKPMIPAKAKSVIFLFMYGGPSHVDTFDYKPKLYDLDGQTIAVKTKGRGGSKNEGRVVGPKWKFKQYGQSGQWVSELFPNLATCVDELAFVKSMTADSPIHGSAMLQMNSGKILSGSPCLGSWINYGLGSVNENLPGFVVMLDPTGGPISGSKNWSSGYMPASYQGTMLRSQGAPVLDLKSARRA